MTRLAYLLIVGVCLGCGSETSTAPAVDNICVVGLRTETMNLHAARQQQSNWCWAACVQAVLSTQGIAVTQEEIVARAFESVANVPASPLVIADRLTGQFGDSDGRAVYLLAECQVGPPSLALLKLHLDAGTPLIVGLANPGSDVGHAVLVTAAVYERTEKWPVLHALVIRDPWLPDGGKRELRVDEFERIFAHVLLTTL